MNLNKTPQTIQTTQRDIDLKEPLQASLIEQSAHAAKAGLDYLVRQQCVDQRNANQGRFPTEYDIQNNQVLSWTPNWLCGIGVSALLIGYRFFSDDLYLQAASRTIEYIKTLQEFSPYSPSMFGAIHETTPQCPSCHPRDALTAAWAMLDYSQETGDDECYQRAVTFAEWFIETAMPQGYPCCTVNFDGTIGEPTHLGSFHSGSACFFARLYSITGRSKYRETMRTILTHYNRHHLDEQGRVTVLLDPETFESLDWHTGENLIGGQGWKCMHVYNDDFGTLANLAAYQIEKDEAYLDAASRFLKHMANIQRSDGGFGPLEFSVPSAGGSVLLEFLAARALGFDWTLPDTVERAVDYLMSRQIRQPDLPAHGGFLGVLHDDYQVSDTCVNMRSTGYAIMALLRCAGAVDPYYFFSTESNFASAQTSEQNA